MDGKIRQYRLKLIDLFDLFIERIPCLKYLFQVTKIRDNREKFSKVRTIFINNKPPDFGVTSGTANGGGGGLLAEPLNYRDNKIVTSKYTLLNFIPKNLYEQFHRIVLIYFFLNSIVLFLITNPPVNPYAATVPMILVIIITSLKQGYEDVLRHIEDGKINKKRVTILRDGKFVTGKSKDIKVGDIVQVKADEMFPCDLLLLYSNSDHGTCYIKTANLDGETNLKQRSIPKQLCLSSSEEELANLRGVITCDKPNLRLYEFKGSLETKERKYFLTNDNILLRGASLKVAPEIYGVCIYAGQDTKMMKNTKIKGNKMSSVEKRMNYFVAAYIFLIVILSLLGVFGSLFYTDVYNDHWYLNGYIPSNQNLYNFITFITFVNLNSLIPLSCYVWLELIKTLGSKFFQWDLEMYDEKTDQPAKANTSDCNEDLGQVQYLFSDKTGTLTENLMIFKHFCVDGEVFAEAHGRIYRQTVESAPPNINEERVSKFIECLSVCHTVQIDAIDKEERYHASSPDELSFVKFCSKIGVNFEGDFLDRDENKIIRRVTYLNTNFNTNNFDNSQSMHKRRASVVATGPPGTTAVVKEYELMHFLDFDSDRKRMSVIVRDLQTDQIMLFCKGADSSVFDKTVCETADMYAGSLKSFSENGWRTLALAYKNLSKDQYQTYRRWLDDATNDVLHRESKLCKAYDKIETELTVIGVTAVEDKLQEGVESTLTALRKAGIKIWVLTGDKLETAINISESCKHFSTEMTKFVMREMKQKMDIKIRLKEIYREIVHHRNQNPFALVVDGITLSSVFETNLQKEFREVAMKCDAVLCCRMSPSQKALIVKLVKTSPSSPLTCAIGDGANDVSMIQEADVGIGIFGKEGRDAARSADFAFVKFKNLKRALLVHGYLYYTRAATLVLYIFYNNFVLNICNIYYAFWTAFSNTNVFSSLILSLYNVFMTGVPILVFALVDQHYKIEKLDKNSFYYKTIANNKWLSPGQFIRWTLLAVWHSLCAFFGAMSLSSSDYLPNGWSGDQAQFGITVLVIILVVVHVKIFLIWNYQNIFALVSYLCSVAGFMVVILANAVIVPFPLTVFTDDQNLYYSVFTLFSSASFWFTTALAAMIAVFPDLILGVLDRIREQRLFTRLENKEKIEKKRNIILNYIKSKTLGNMGLTVNENVQLQMVSNAVGPAFDDDHHDHTNYESSQESNVDLASNHSKKSKTSSNKKSESNDRPSTSDMFAVPGTATGFPAPMNDRASTSASLKSDKK